MKNMYVPDIGNSSRGVIQKRGEKKKRKWKKRTQERLFDKFPHLSTSSYTLQFEQGLKPPVRHNKNVKNLIKAPV